MGQTLTNGIYLPDEGERNSYSGLEVNWRTLDALILTVNGKAAPNVANTWTAEQTFTAGIIGDLTGNVTGNVTGNLTGTASNAIADEDGTSIKTGYGKLAGNQTWTGTNTYTGASAIRFNNTSYVSGTPSGNIFYSTVQWGGYVNNTWSAPFTINNAIRTNGYNDTSFRTYSQTSNTLTGFVHETNADASDIAFRPIVNGTHKLGSSSYQWSSVYAQTYYYNGTAWGLDKVNEWTENNLFSKRSDPASVTSIADTTLAFNGLFNTIFLNTRGSSNRRSYGSFLFVGYGSASGADNYGQIQLLRSTDKRGDTNEGYIPDTSFKLLRVNPHSLLIDFMENVRVVNDGTYNTLCPITTDTTDLGTSTNKWKTINGVNPGALSLPDNSKSVAIDITNWDVAGGTNVYTPPANGWLHIRVKGATELIVRWADWRFGDRRVSATATDLGVTIPVVAGVTVDVVTVASSFNSKCQFFPCLGNV